LITSRDEAGKTTKIFFGNMIVLLFKDEEYKGPIFGKLQYWKNLRAFM
jgi:hypothetical protein